MASLAQQSEDVIDFSGLAYFDSYQVECRNGISFKSLFFSSDNLLGEDKDLGLIVSIFFW